MPGLKDVVNLARLAKPLTWEEGLSVLERDRFRCQYCGLDGMASFENYLVMSVDFVVPRAGKGKKNPSNLVAACRPCNRLKGRRAFHNFAEAKAHVLKQRAELHQQWESRMAKSRGKSATV